MKNRVSRQIRFEQRLVISVLSFCLKLSVSFAYV
jgi:hypothetical protein